MRPPLFLRLQILVIHSAGPPIFKIMRTVADRPTPAGGPVEMTPGPSGRSLIAVGLTPLFSRNPKRRKSARVAIAYLPTAYYDFPSPCIKQRCGSANGELGLIFWARN